MGLMAIFMMFIYSNGETLDHQRNAYLAQYTLGNLGQSFADCISQNVGIQIQQTFSCNKGMELKKRFHSIIPYKPGMVDVNGHSFGNDFCGDPSLIRDEDSCRDVIDS